MAGGAAAGGAGIQAVAQHVDQLIGYGLNAMAASKSHDRQKNMMTRGYLYAQEGLEAAGLNRILALGSQGLGGGSAKAVQAHAAGKGGKIDNPMLAASQMRLQGAQSNQANRAADLLTEQTRGVVNDNVPKGYLSAYLATNEGYDDLIRTFKNKSYPDSFAAATVKGIGTAKDYFQRTFNRSRDPYQGRSITPRDFNLERKFDQRK